MDLRALHAFMTVADTGSFSEAANQLHLTQSAVSKRIAALEGDLGCTLFDRIGRRVALTEAGRALLPNARRTLEAAEDGRRAIRNLSGSIAGRLSLGTSHHIGLHRLPSVLQAFHADHPEVELDIRFMDSEQACLAVELGELELAVVTLPLTPMPTLDTREIWPDPLAVVCGPRHPLASAHRPDLAALTRHPAVLPGRGTYTRQTVENALAPLGLELNVTMSTNYLETIKMLVSIGLGWSVLPASMLDPGLCVLDIPELRLCRRLGLVRHRLRTLSNAAAAFRAALEADGATATAQGASRGVPTTHSTYAPD